MASCPKIQGNSPSGSHPSKLHNDYLRVDVGVTERVRQDLHPDLALLGDADLDLGNVEGLLGFPGDSGQALDDLAIGGVQSLKLLRG